MLWCFWCFQSRTQKLAREASFWYLGKLWIWHPKHKAALCFPQKNLPTFFRTVNRGGGEKKTLFWRNTSYRGLSFCLPNSPLPLSLWKKYHVFVLLRLVLMNMHERLILRCPNFCNFGKLLRYGCWQMHYLCPRHITHCTSIILVLW